MVQSANVVVQGTIDLTELSISITDLSPVALDWQLISGVLTVEATGLPHAGRTVYLYKNEISVASVVTDAEGAYLFEVQFYEGTYSIYTFYAAETGYWESYSPTLTVVAFRPTTSITITANPVTAEPPFEVTISGALTRDDTEEGIPVPVDLYRNDTLIETKFSGSGGAYAFSDTVNAVGEFTYYTTFEGNDKFQGCEGVILPCPSCRRPIDIRGKVEADCRFCGAVSDVVPIFG